MSGPDDDLGRLADDLRAWLRQQREAGVEWFLDPGSAGAPAAAVPPPAPVPAAPAVRASRAAAAAVGAQDAKETKDAAFAAICAAFVADTVARVTQATDAVTQGDIFGAPAAEPERLTREQKAAALAELAAEVRPCAGCKLASTRTQTVFGVGDPDAGLVFIGEAPGRDEDLQGEPFVGRAGQLLNDILKAIQLDRDQVYICNILKCRPPENRDPERDEVEACEPHLQRQLAILEPDAICCLGRHAAHTLLRTNASLNALRERAHFYGRTPVVVTYHPAALLRNPHWKRPTWDDVRKLRALYDALRERRSA